MINPRLEPLYKKLNTLKKSNNNKNESHQHYTALIYTKSLAPIHDFIRQLKHSNPHFKNYQLRHYNHFSNYDFAITKKAEDQHDDYKPLELTQLFKLMQSPSLFDTHFINCIYFNTTGKIKTQQFDYLLNELSETKDRLNNQITFLCIPSSSKKSIIIEKKCSINLELNVPLNNATIKDLLRQVFGKHNIKLSNTDFNNIASALSIWQNNNKIKPSDSQLLLNTINNQCSIYRLIINQNNENIEIKKEEQKEDFSLLRDLLLEENLVKIFDCTDQFFNRNFKLLNKSIILLENSHTPAYVFYTILLKNYHNLLDYKYNLSTTNIAPFIKQKLERSLNAIGSISLDKLGQKLFELDLPLKKQVDKYKLIHELIIWWQSQH